MKKKFFLLTQFSFLFCCEILLASPVFAEPILVEGSIDDLPAVVHSQLFKDSSIILFTHDLSWDQWSRFANEENAYFGSAIFKGARGRDAAIEIATTQKIVASDFRKKVRLKFQVPKKAVYEIFLNIEKIRFPENLALTVRFGSQSLPAIQKRDILSCRGRYLKIGETKLIGGQKITFSAELSGNKKLPPSFRDLLFLLTLKEEREKIEMSLEEKFFLSAEATKEVSLIFDRGDGTFEVPESWRSTVGGAAWKQVDCLLKVKLNPKGKAIGSVAAGESPADKNAAGIAICEIDGVEVLLADGAEKTWLEKIISLRHTGNQHTFSFPENDFYEVEWALLEPASVNLAKGITASPRVSFKRINPTKHLIRVQSATAPFWLIFSEAYHDKWLLFQPRPNDRILFNKPSSWAPIASYSSFSVEEAEHSTRATPFDAAYLMRSPLAPLHLTVNGFANGWYIIPEELGLGQSFDLVLFFRPQAYFYLGLFVAAATLFLTTVILLTRNIIAKTCRPR